MSEELCRCRGCGETWDIKVKEDILNFAGVCWLCHRLKEGKETSSDCITKVIRDFRNFSQEDYLKWLITDNRLSSLPEPQKRQLNALIANIETRAGIENKQLDK